MATFLLTWELGGGMGHCVNLYPIAKYLCHNGHKVYIAIRDVSTAKIFDNLNVTILQAPYMPDIPKYLIQPPRTFAHILHNTGFGDFDDLRLLTNAWYNLFVMVGVDVLVFEHSPSALLASYRIDVRRVVVGTGFFSPPNIYPWPDLQQWMYPEPNKLQQDEDVINCRVCKLLETWKSPPTIHISQLYGSIDANCLLTFLELDHYANRQDGNYWGNWSLPGGDVPEWPSGDGKRIFGYFRYFNKITTLLSLLNSLNVCALLNVPDGLTNELKKQFESEKIHFVDRRLDMKQVIQSCDLAILNGNAGTAITLLLGGIPTFCIPLYLEQAVFSHCLSGLGVGLIGAADEPKQIANGLITMLQNPSFSTAASKFATKYSNFDQDNKMIEMSSMIESLV